MVSFVEGMEEDFVAGLARERNRNSDDGIEADYSAQVMTDADSASSEDLEAAAEILDRLIEPSERLMRLESF